MKKLIVPAFCLGLIFGSATLTAGTSTSISIQKLVDDERKALKPEELPEPVRKTLAGAEYKDWTVKEATMITHNVPGDAKATKSWYEVKVVKGQENKTLNFNADGTVVK